MTEARAWLWFQTADASGNGALECSELQTAFRILQLLASPARHLPWDSYFAFDSDPKDHTTRFRPGKVDVVAFHGICRAYGLRVSLAKAEAVFQKLDPAGKLRVPYRKFFDGFATLLDPRFELTRRGINPRQLPAGLPRNPREAARVVISEEEARLVVQVQQAAAAAAADRKAERQEHELLSKGAWVRRQMEYRKAKRAAALRERAGQRAKEPALLPSVLLLDASRNALRTLPGLKLFAQLEALRKLDVSSNCLTSLPAAISWCARLQILNASANVLEGVPAELGSLGELVLDLSRNRIERLGPVIGMHSSLAQLVLEGNLLSELPDELGQTASLVELCVAGNMLTQLQDAVCARLGSLRTLDASNNRLRSVSPALGRITTLRHLNLFHNLLETLPLELAPAMTRLESFDVGRNPLSELPRKLAGVRPLGVRALATSLQSPWLQVGYLAQANARAREARAVRQVEDANEAADAVEAQRAGMLLEDGRAKEWELAGVNLELRLLGHRVRGWLSGNSSGG
ncbi:hypothetical protein FNF28_01390 [Cafeteria roenbergensis]|uniref:Uncharacterized protein n=1 Tax=Cafeteria roenbergensis TaxID=33653 RepID=A0A5A8DZR6_CAFRO|nr:hypothetical protein FNF28_01390 [Cafeteria roenbergensis]